MAERPRVKVGRLDFPPASQKQLILWKVMKLQFSNPDIWAFV